LSFTTVHSHRRHPYILAMSPSYRDPGGQLYLSRRTTINLLPLQRGLINERLQRVDVFMHSLTYLTHTMTLANVWAKVRI
jgi:hypothetical protein